MTTDDRLVRIEAKVDDLREMTAASTALHNACRKQQGEHHATLYGPNGVTYRVQSLEHSRWYARAAFGGLWAVVIAAITILFAWIARVPLP